MDDVPPESGARRGAARTLSPARLKRAFGAAFAGVRAVWRTEGNFRIQTVLAALALLLGLALRADLVPVFLACALVLSLELLNSALESTLDLLSPEFHPLVKRAKDAAAGAVLVAAIFSVLVGLWVLGPPLWRTVFG